MITPLTGREPLTLDDARTWARIGVLAALAVVAGWIEMFIPLPLPVAGVKLGLANIVVLVALQLLGPGPAALVAVVKVLSTGFLFGNPLMMLFSAAGTALAYVCMVVLVRIPGLHIGAVSVVAAMAHNIGQLAVAQGVLDTPLVWYSAPFMLLAACITGALSGAAAKWTLDALQEDTFFAHVHQQSSKSARAGRQAADNTPALLLPARTTLSDAPIESGVSPARPQSFLQRLIDVDVRIKAFLLLAYFLVAFHANHAVVLVGVAIVAVVAALVTKVHITEAARVFVPLLFIVGVTVVMQLVYRQEGTVLAQLGPLALTDDGVWHALRMVIAQASVVVASVAFMRTVEPTDLIRVFAWVVKPLENFGINADAIILSLTVAMAFVPVLVQEFTLLRQAHKARGASFEGSFRTRLVSSTRLLAPLVRRSFRHADNVAESLLSRAF